MNTIFQKDISSWNCSQKRSLFLESTIAAGFQMWFLFIYLFLCISITSSNTSLQALLPELWKMHQKRSSQSMPARWKILHIWFFKNYPLRPAPSATLKPAAFCWDGAPPPPSNDPSSVHSRSPTLILHCLVVVLCVLLFNLSFSGTVKFYQMDILFLFWISSN